MLKCSTLELSVDTVGAVSARSTALAHPGGLNKIVHDVSHTSKKAGSDAKAEKNRVKSTLHGGATEAGKSIKGHHAQGQTPEIAT